MPKPPISLNRITRNSIGRYADEIDENNSMLEQAFNPEHYGDGTHKAMTTPGITAAEAVVSAGLTLGGVRRLTFPAAGSATQALDDILKNGDSTSRSATFGALTIGSATGDVTATLPITPIATAFFDNSADPAWLDRCSDKSWYSETRSNSKQFLTANYVNDAAALAANPTIAIGDVYYTGSVFNAYGIGATTRAGTKKFPMRGFVTAEAGRAIIWDSTHGSPSMWAVTSVQPSISSIAAINGSICLASSVHGLAVYDFKTGAWVSFGVGGKVSFTESVFSSIGSANNTEAAKAIVNRIVNSVAITHLPSAPIENGLKVPTIVVGTAGGLSIIKDDGTTVTPSGAGAYFNCEFDKQGNLYAANATVSTYLQYSEPPYASLTNVFTGATSIPAPLIGSGNNRYRTGVFSNSAGLTLLKHNITAPTSSLNAYITNTYNTGYMVGDIRRCILADSGSIIGDKSVKAGLPAAVGVLTYIPVAGGRTAISGFSATNYIQEASHADWNALGTGDFCIRMTGVKWGAAGFNGFILSLGDGVSAGSMYVSLTALNVINLYIHNGISLTLIGTSTSSFSDIALHTLEVKRSGTTVTVLVDGELVCSATSALSISNLTGFLRIGEGQHASAPWIGGSFETCNIEATAPTAEQSKFIADQESAIKGGGLCLLSNSALVSGLTYDDKTDTHQVKNGANTDLFKGLKRIDSVVTTAGFTAAPCPALTGTKYYAPTINVNAELNAANEKLSKAATKPKSFGFNGNAAITLFELQSGWRPQSVYVAGVRKFEGATSDYTITYDGFIYGVSFAVAPALGTNNVVIEGVLV